MLEVEWSVGDVRLGELGFFAAMLEGEDGSRPLEYLDAEDCERKAEGLGRRSEVVPLVDMFAEAEWSG